MTSQRTGGAVPAELLPPAQGGEVVTTGGPSSLSLDAIRDLERGIDQRVQLLDRIKAIIDHRVSTDCFDRFEDKKPDGSTAITVRRNKNYADVVAATIGASFRYLKDPDGKPLFQRINYQDDVGPYYVYECFGVASIPGMIECECSGAASSRDKFLSRGRKLATDEVDERFVRQMAATECKKKGILSLLGLSGDGTVEEMSRVGKDAAGFAGHKFQAGKSGGSTDNGAQADKRAEIERMARGLLAAGWERAGTPRPTTANAVVEQVTQSAKFRGWKTIASITDKGLDVTFEQVKKVFDATVGAQAAGDNPDNDGGGSNGGSTDKGGRGRDADEELPLN